MQHKREGLLKKWLAYKHRNRSEYTRDMVHFHTEPCVGTGPYSIKVKLDIFADFPSSCLVSQIFLLKLQLNSTQLTQLKLTQIASQERNWAV